MGELLDLAIFFVQIIILNDIIFLFFCFEVASETSEKKQPLYLWGLEANCGSS